MDYWGRYGPRADVSHRYLNALHCLLCKCIHQTRGRVKKKKENFAPTVFLQKAREKMPPEVERFLHVLLLGTALGPRAKEAS